jgi:hypothetical protein
MNNQIDWSAVVNSISTTEGEVRTIGENFYTNSDGKFNQILNLWNNAGYKKQHIEWINYYPNTNFDDIITKKFSDLVSATHIRSWISCIRPGKSAPWHQDIDDNMESYLPLGKLVRYTCHITEPHLGQIMLIEKTAYYMTPYNTITKWPSIEAWHGASNCGFENQYLYHFLGYE